MINDKMYAPIPQYTLSQSLGIWAAATLPMAVLGWLATPLLAPFIDPCLSIAGVTRVLLLTLGLIWQFIFTLLIVRREAGALTWAIFRQRLWLTPPRDPLTGLSYRRLWLWLLPLFLALFVIEFCITPLLNERWVAFFPWLAEPPAYSLATFMNTPANRLQLVGAWWFFALFLLLALFNTVLGEELLFHGLLLPRMQGAFGRWDWAVNGLFYGFYHLHQPWGIPGNILGTCLFAFGARRFQCTWVSIILHSAQSVFFGVLILGLVLGMGG